MLLLVDLISWLLSSTLSRDEAVADEGKSLYNDDDGMEPASLRRLLPKCKLIYARTE